MISIKFRRKIYIFSKKLNKYHPNHQEISYKHMKNINIHIETQKTFNAYGNKQNLFKTWTIPYVYPREHIKFH